MIVNRGACFLRKGIDSTNMVGAGLKDLQLCFKLIKLCANSMKNNITYVSSSELKTCLSVYSTDYYGYHEEIHHRFQNTL